LQKRIPQLDAIRAIAVAVVFVHNTDAYPSLHLGLLARYGWMGVDLFFVLSGFLITGILLDTKDDRGYFRNFYARRCLRIWPLYYCALLFMFVLVPLLKPSEAHMVFAPRSMPWWSYLIFLQNFFVPAITNATGLLAVTWSLAVEEQFYLVWPVIVRLCSEARLRQIAIAVIALSPAVRFVLAHRHFDIYPNTFCRLDGLMAGALLALSARRYEIGAAKREGLAWSVFLGSLILAILSASHDALWIAFSFTALTSVAFVWLGLYSKQGWFQSILTNRVLLYTGTISYGIYLIEKIPSDIGQSVHADRHPGLFFAAVAIVTYVAAVVSWNLLEKPCLRLKRLFESQKASHNASEGPFSGQIGPQVSR
jgi:peptidoglycan/LPS O-acetylase OafA/YrhL